MKLKIKEGTNLITDFNHWCYSLTGFTSPKTSTLIINNFFYFINWSKTNRIAIYISKFLDVVVLKDYREFVFS